MAISAAQVKELREMSGAGMMDCKKALTECDGDMDKAMESLRKSGAAKVAKKASRIAAEGVVMTSVSGNSAVIVEVNSETDFVAKNDTFKAFVKEVADKALTSNVDKADENVVEVLDMSKELEDATLKIGEKISLRRFEKVSADCVETYIHGGGKIGVIIAGSGDSSDSSKEALKNIAMQVAAMKPEFITRDEISDDQRAKEKEITIDSALNDPASLPKPILNSLIEKAVSSKWSKEDVDIYEEKKSNMQYLFNFLSKEAIASLAELAMESKNEILENKIFSGLVEGRLSKHFKDICLYDQTYVKAEDGKQSVKAYIESVNKDLVVTKIVRFECGEGIEKKQEDFAAEVAAQMNA